MNNAVLGCGEGPWETKSCLRGKPLQHAPWPWAPSWGDHHNIIVASDVDHVGVGGDDIFELMVMILRMIRADGTKKWCLMMMMRQQLMNNIQQIHPSSQNLMTMSLHMLLCLSHRKWTLRAFRRRGKRRYSYKHYHCFLWICLCKLESNKWIDQQIETQMNKAHC